MNKEMHARKIKLFKTWDARGNEAIIQLGSRNVFSDDYPPKEFVTDIYLSATYHGDRDEFWIVEIIGSKDTFKNRERRHNLKHVAMFEFEEKEKK